MAASTAHSRRWGRQKDTAPEASAEAEAACLGNGRLSVQENSAAPPRSARLGKSLSPEQLEAFTADGFVAVRPQVPPGTHASIIKAADAAYEAAGFDGRQSSSPIGNNILAEVPQLQTVFGSAEVDGALRDLLGEGYIAHPHRRPHQNDPGSRPQTLHKDSHAGFEVHRAHSPWLVMAMYYPQAVTLENAPTSLCPGTYFYAGEDRFDPRHLDSDQARTSLQRWSSEEVPMTCEAGTVVLVHNDLWHRGTGNRSKARRWMFCFMYMRAVSPQSGGPLPTFKAPQHSDLAREQFSAYVRAWLHGIEAPRVDVDVKATEAALAQASDDQARLVAAYSLASASDFKSASEALARVLREGREEPLRRAAKFGAAAACHRQVLRGETEMLCRLLELVAEDRDPGASACAARALFEHGGWPEASPASRARAAEVLAAALRAPRPRPTPRPAEAAGPPTEGSGRLRGTVISWKESRDSGFIRPSTRGDDLWVVSSAFGGGALVQGLAVSYDELLDNNRTGKRCAVNVAGPAVQRSGGRRVAWRNARAAAAEALAVVPQSCEDAAAPLAAEALGNEMAALSQRLDAIVGDPARLEDGEVLMAAALGAVRLVTRCGAAASAAPWWRACLRGSLLKLVLRGAEIPAPSGARRAASGGTPGADNGLRYALAYALEALRRSGDQGALLEASMAFPDLHAALAAGIAAEEALLLRRCHLTTRDHTF